MDFLPALVAMMLATFEVDAAVKTRSYQSVPESIVGPGSRKVNQHVVTPPEYVDHPSGQRSVPSGARYVLPEVVGVGADGTVAVELKLDLHALLAAVNTIPQLQQDINGLSQRLDVLINNMGTGSGGGGGGSDQAVEQMIIALERALTQRMDQQDAKMDSLVAIIQQLQSALGMINSQINQVIQSIQNVSGGGTTTCDLQNVDGLLSQTLTIVSRIEASLSQNVPSGTGQQNIDDTLQKISIVAQESLALLEQARQPGVICPAINPTEGGNNVELQILQQTTAIISYLERLPQQITITLQNSGMIGGSGGGAELIPYLQQLLQLEEQCRRDVLSVKTIVVEVTAELRKHFAESQKSLVAVKKVVTETTEIVQSSAAAAISASRSLKCPSKTAKPDLDD